MRLNSTLLEVGICDTGKFAGVLRVSVGNLAKQLGLSLRRSPRTSRQSRLTLSNEIANHTATWHLPGIQGPDRSEIQNLDAASVLNVRLLFGVGFYWNYSIASIFQDPLAHQGSSIANNSLYLPHRFFITKIF